MGGSELKVTRRVQYHDVPKCKKTRRILLIQTPSELADEAYSTKKSLPNFGMRFADIRSCTTISWRFKCHEVKRNISLKSTVRDNA